MIIYAKQNKGVYAAGFYPCPETDAFGNKSLNWTDTRFRALHFVYDITVQVLHEPEDLIALKTPVFVAIEQQNEHTEPLSDFVHPEKVLYIVGSSRYEYPSFWFDTPLRVHIDVPHMKYPFYGDQALAIALNDRYLKNGKNI